MAMEDLLESYKTKQTLSLSRFQLDKNVHDLLIDFLGPGEKKLKISKVESTDRDLKAEGKLYESLISDTSLKENEDNAAFGRMLYNITFLYKGKGATAKAYIDLSVPKGWKFYKTKEKTKGPLLSDLVFSEGRLTFQPSSTTYPLASFEGKLSGMGMLKSFATLLNAGEDLPVSGTILKKENVLHTNLKVPLGEKAGIGPFNLHEPFFQLKDFRKDYSAKNVRSEPWLFANVKAGEKTIELSSLLPIGGDFFTFRARPENLPLNDLTALAEIFPGVDISSSIGKGPDITKNIGLSEISVTIMPKKMQVFSIKTGFSLLKEWEIIENKISIDNTKILLTLLFPFKKQQRDFYWAIAGDLLLDSKKLRVSAYSPGFSINAFTGEGFSMDLKALLESLVPKSFPLPDIMPAINLNSLFLEANPGNKSLAFKGEAKKKWDLIPGMVSVENMRFSFSSRPGAKKGEHVKKGELIASAEVVGLKLDVASILPGNLLLKGKYEEIDLASVYKKIEGFVADGGISMPSGFLNLTMKNVDISLMPNLPGFSIASAAGPFDAVEVILCKSKKGKWAAGVGLKPGKKWKFSHVNKAFKCLDSMDLSNAALIVSSLEGSPLNFQRVYMPRAKLQLSKGLNFAGTMTLKDTGLDKLLGIETIVMQAAIGKDPRKFMLEGSVAGEMKLAKNVTMSQIGLRIIPGGTTPEFMAICRVVARVNEEDLAFMGALSVMPNGATFAATMKGTWQNAFGAKGFNLSDVAIELGISFQGLPSIGLAGRMKIGKVEGGAAVAFNAADPTQSMLAVSFDQLLLADLLSAFCDPKVKGSAKDLKKVLKDTGLEDVKVHVVPAATRIGEIYFESGITVKGKLEIMDWEGSINATIDYMEGIFVEGKMESIEAGDIFALTGAGEEKDPLLKLDLRISSTPSLTIACAVSLLGLKQATYISISDKGFRFLVVGKIFDLFQAELDVNGKDIFQSGEFMIRASLQNDLISYLNENVREGIKKVAESAVKELTKAQGEVDKAKKEVEKLDSQIKSARAQVRSEREVHKKELNKAKEDLKKARDDVNKLNREISKQRNIIKRERAATQRDLKNAENKVSAAERDVKGLKNQVAAMRTKVKGEQEKATRDIRSAEKKIDSARKKINNLNDDIKRKKSDIKKYEKKMKKEWYNPKWAAKCAGANVEIGALYVARDVSKEALKVAKGVLSTVRKGVKLIPVDSDPRVAGLIVGQKSAEVALKAAKEVLKGIKNGLSLIPPDSDPRVAGPIALRETAQGGLTIAQKSIDAAKTAIDTTPVDLDPRVAGLIVAKETARGALEAGKIVLEGVKLTVKEGAKAADCIANYGLGGIFDLKKVCFEGELSAVDGGSVSLEMDLRIMGKEENIKVEFNFKDLADSIAGLVTHALQK
ncbi:MAG: hypothetical protein OEV42_03370 [Deltaproteobacteria bacterium]|nr:hypothetical protein [Deltaproteobacteria bacterium]